MVVWSTSMRFGWVLGLGRRRRRRFRRWVVVMDAHDALRLARSTARRRKHDQGDAVTRRAIRRGGSNRHAWSGAVMRRRLVCPLRVVWVAVRLSFGPLISQRRRECARSRRREAVVAASEGLERLELARRSASRGPVRDVRHELMQEEGAVAAGAVKAKEEGATRGSSRGK